LHGKCTVQRESPKSARNARILVKLTQDLRGAGRGEGRGGESRSSTGKFIERGLGRWEGRGEKSKNV